MKTFFKIIGWCIVGLAVGLVSGGLTGILMMYVIDLFDASSPYAQSGLLVGGLTGGICGAIVGAEAAGVSSVFLGTRKPIIIGVPAGALVGSVLGALIGSSLQDIMLDRLYFLADIGMLAYIGMWVGSCVGLGAALIFAVFARDEGGEKSSQQAAIDQQWSEFIKERARGFTDK